MRLGRLRRMGRRGVAAVVVVLLAVVGTGAWLLTRPSGAAAAQQVTATVAAGTYQQTVSATGTLEPTREADLDFAVSGRVTSVRVAAGDKVSKGDRLATLDTSLARRRPGLGAGPARRGAGAVRRRRGCGRLLHPARGRQAVRRGGQVRPQPGRRTTWTRRPCAPRMSGTVASVDLTVGEQVSGSRPRRLAGSDGAAARRTAPVRRQLRGHDQPGRGGLAAPLQGGRRRQRRRRRLGEEGHAGAGHAHRCDRPRLRHGHRRRPGGRGQLVGCGDVPGHGDGHRRAVQAVRRHVRDRLDHHQAGQRRARRTDPRAAHLRLHDVRREAGRREAGAHDRQGGRDLRQQHRGHLGTEVRRQGRARHPQAPHRQRQQPRHQRCSPAAARATSPAAGRAEADRPTATSRARRQLRARSSREPDRARRGPQDLRHRPRSRWTRCAAWTRASRRASTSRSPAPAGRASPR